jgi:Undecaprenyl-phosphate galactose phosphotransferase WbaP
MLAVTRTTPLVGFHTLDLGMKRGDKMRMQEARTAKFIAGTEDHWAHRTLDVFVAGVALLFFAPLMLLVGVLVKLDSPGPVLFRHKRIGKDGRQFYCVKFRSMASDSDERLRRLLDSDAEAREEWEATHKLKNDPRITRLGAFLRKSSLDELPQLWNILANQMALVGPRPIVSSEVVHYGDHFAEYCAVKPGLTGLWQVSGRNDTSYAERVALDVRYVRDRSVFFDLRILAATMPAVLLRRGSY